ncbi:MAG TPA: thioesterase [Bacteroidales bacterium]|nr:thioesterase [Bacteroidales bacterium]
MREIGNPWVCMEGYNCFGCSPDNPLGLHMRFYEDGDDIVSVWCPTQNHQSWVNTLHGGVQAVLLDEICGWVVFRKLQTSGVTGKMEIRYRHAINTTGKYLFLRARLKERQHCLAVVEAEIQNADGVVCATCECTYFTFSGDKAEQMAFRPAECIGDELTLQEVVERRAVEPHYKRIN